MLIARTIVSSCLFLCSSLVSAGTMGASSEAPNDLHAVLTLQGGYASINSDGHVQRFVGPDSDLFIYSPSETRNNKGFVGLFVGGEHSLPTLMSYPALVQAGVEYNAFGQQTIKGINTVGVDASSSTQYAYQYKVKTQQILGDIKLLTTVHERFHPYLEAGLGIAINDADTYHASTTETGSINLTPTLANQATIRTSYILGLGLDANLNKHVRVGLGYRYSYFGAASLGNGSVAVGTNQIPGFFNVQTSGLYANQLIAHASLIF